ncbi:MAG: hypothetical protein AAF745_16610 [Planctomycetota bacterium]
MQRIESLRDDYLPAFKQLASEHGRPIQAGCEISYGVGQQSPGSLDEWPVKSHHLLQGQPPLGGAIYWKASEANATIINRWFDLAGESSKLLGDWVKPLGLDPRVVRPRWEGCWFTLFREFHRIEAFPFPVKLTRSVKQSDFVLVNRDKRPLIYQTPAELPERPELCYATSELIRVPDLFKATVLAIRCIVDAKETRKPKDWGAGPAVMVCGWCKRERDADPYCPPWRCIWCGKDYGTKPSDTVRNAAVRQFAAVTKMFASAKQAQRDSWRKVMDEAKAERDELYQREVVPMFDELREAAQRDNDELSERKLPTPRTLQQWERLARIVECPIDDIRSGNLTVHEIFEHAIAWVDRKRVETKLAGLQQAATERVGGINSGERKPQRTKRVATEPLETMDGDELCRWSEIADVHLQWLENGRKPSQSTPETLRGWLEEVGFDGSPREFEAMRQEDRTNKSRHGYATKGRGKTPLPDAIANQRVWCDVLKSMVSQRGL